MKWERNIFLIVFFTILKSFSQTENFAEQDQHVSYLNYIQNKGQWDPKVLYQGDFRGGRIFLENSAFTFLFYPSDGFRRLHPHQRMNGENDSIFNFHVVKIEFTETSAARKIIADGKREHYYNYFLGNDPKKWASGVPIFKNITYKNIYDGITVKVFGKGNSVRYDFVVAPGADPSKIKLKFSGQDKLFLREGKLILSTSVGQIEQEEPFAFQIENGKRKKIKCRYELTGNIVSINVSGNYNKNKTLTIDPTLVFATYTGSTADNWGMTATYDNAGNAYTSGIVFGAGYPVTTGSYQTSFGGGSNFVEPGGFDISVSKFDATGSSLLYSTYLGGNNDESPQSIIIDNNNDLVMLGRTFSANFPITSGAYDNTLSGTTDLIVVKFNSTGTTLLASTYVGGSGTDGVNISDAESVLGSIKFNYADDGRGDILIDNNNNIYVASCTSSGDFPVTPGCLQSTNAGAQDGCVFKMNSSLSSFVFSTYLGGTGNDAAYNIALDNKNRLYITGGTESADFPTTSGVLHPSYMGNIDGFVTHLSYSGSSILKSGYIGTAAYDQSYFVQTDKLDNVYLYGQSSGNYPITSGVYSNANSGQFIHEMDSTLSTTIFSTEFGAGKGTPDIVPSAFLVDNCQNIYVSGWGGILFNYNNSFSTTTGMPVTSDAFMSNTDGSDFYFMVLQKNAAALSYATFFGGQNSPEHVDGGTSRFDKSGVIYQAICESCQGWDDMPTTPGAWSSQNGSFNCNNALVKFKFDMHPTLALASATPASAAGCAPLTLNFINNSVNATSFKWFFGDGDSSTALTPSHQYTIPGDYRLMMVATDQSTCNISDTTYTTVRVRTITHVPLTPVTICIGDSIQISLISSASPTSQYSWTPSASLTGATTFNPVLFPQSTTFYNVTVTDSFCAIKDSVEVTVLKYALANTAVNSNAGCSPLSINFINNSLNTSNYKWYFGDGDSSALFAPSHLYTTAGDFRVMLIGSDTNTCNRSDTAYATVRVRTLAHVPLLPEKICKGDSTQITLVSNASSTAQYSWTPSASIADATTNSPILFPQVNTLYFVTVADSFCTLKDSIKITVLDYAMASATVSSGTGCSPFTVNFINNSLNVSNYKWYFGDGDSSSVLAPSHLYTTAGDYHVILIGSDTNSCNRADTAYAIIKVKTLMHTPLLPVKICKGDSVQINFVSNASSTAQYSWTPSAFLTGATTSDPVFFPEINTLYHVSVADSFCTAIDSVAISIDVNQPVIINSTFNLCIDDTIHLSANTADVSYLWSNGQTTKNINVTTAGLYILSSWDSIGCKGNDSVLILDYAHVPVVAGDTVICGGGDGIQISTTQGAYGYSWKPSLTLDNPAIYNPIANPSSTTVYTVSIANGPCITTSTYTVNINVPPSLYVHPQYSLILPGESVNLNAISSYACIWSSSYGLSCTACSSPIATPDSNYVYYVTATDNLGCSNTDTVVINIKPTFYVPNCFTPNSNGINDVFRPVFAGYTDLDVWIFDRWGEEIYHYNTLHGGWDGTYKGKLVEEGVYVYKIEATDYLGYDLSKIGHVTVVR